jgi:hypothetical protein
MQNHCAKVLLTIWLLILSMRRCHRKQKKSLGSMYVFSHFWFIFFPEFFNLFYWSIYWSVFIFLFFLPCISWYRESHLTTRFVFLKSSFYMAFFPISFFFVVCFCTQLTVLLFFQTPGYYPWMHEQNKLVNGEYHIVLFVISSFCTSKTSLLMAVFFFECRWYWLHWRNAYFLILFHVLWVSDFAVKRRWDATDKM